jgi:catalase (peroxidase I)
MTALVGRLRVLGASRGESEQGVCTQLAGQLINEFFVNLVDMSVTWPRFMPKTMAKPRSYATLWRLGRR